MNLNPVTLYQLKRLRVGHSGGGATFKDRIIDDLVSLQFRRFKSTFPELSGVLLLYSKCYIESLALKSYLEP